MKLWPSVYLVVNSASGYVAEVFDSPTAASRYRDQLGSGWHVITRTLRPVPPTS